MSGKLDIVVFAEWLEWHQGLNGDLSRDKDRSVVLANLFYEELGHFSRDQLLKASRKVADSDARLFSAADHLSNLKAKLPAARNPEKIDLAAHVCQMCHGSGYVQVDLRKAIRTSDGWTHRSNTVACKCRLGESWAIKIDQPPLKKIPAEYPDVFRPETFDEAKHVIRSAAQATVTREEAMTMIESCDPVFRRIIVTSFMRKSVKRNADGTECSEEQLQELRERVVV